MGQLDARPREERKPALPYPPAPTFPVAREVGGERALPFLPSAPRMVKPKGLLGGCWPRDTASLACGPVTEQKFGRLEQDLLEHRTPWERGSGRQQASTPLQAIPRAMGLVIPEVRETPHFVSAGQAGHADDPYLTFQG